MQNLCVRIPIWCEGWLIVWSFVLWQLLGKDSHDIDIALDDMLGKQFCEKVNEYLKCIGEETSGIGVIQRYPITQLLKLFLLSRYETLP